MLSAWHLLAPPHVDYILVIDAGSSGTRMFAYTWRAAASSGAPPLVSAIPPSAAAHAVPRRAMPAKRAYQRVETEPGLDRFVGDKRGLQEKAIGALSLPEGSLLPSALCHAFLHSPADCYAEKLVALGLVGGMWGAAVRAVGDLKCWRALGGVLLS